MGLSLIDNGRAVQLELLRVRELDTMPETFARERTTADEGDGLMMNCVRMDEHGESHLVIEGALDALTVRDIRAVIDAVVADGPRRVTVDLENVRLLDSTGIGAIVSLSKRVKANGGEVVVVGAREQPLAVLKLLKLDDYFGLGTSS